MMTTPQAIVQVIACGLLIGGIFLCVALDQAAPKIRRKQVIWMSIGFAVGVLLGLLQSGDDAKTKIANADRVWKMFEPTTEDPQPHFGKEVTVYGTVAELKTVSDGHVTNRALGIVDNDGRKLKGLLVLKNDKDHPKILPRDKVKVQVHFHPKNVHAGEHWVISSVERLY